MTKKMNDILKFVNFDIVSSPKPLTMALNIQKIKEVVEYGNLSPMPDACENVIGIYDFRGTPVSVFDVLGVITKSEKRPEKTIANGTMSRILICDLQSTLIGFPVAKTGRTISCQSSSFLPPPKGGFIGGKKVISGVIRREDSYIPVLDLDSILEMLEPDTRYDVSSFAQSNLFAGKRVLIVEDSKLILKKLVQVFSEMGFTVDTAENGSEGLKKCGKECRYDLIFTDIEMPLLDGISMVRKIKQQPEYASVPVLFNSALSNPALISDIESENLGRYIVKYDKNLIVAEVNAAMKKQAA